MEGDPVPDGDADAAELVVAAPDAAAPRITPRDHAAIGSQPQHQLFETGDMIGHGKMAGSQMDNRIDDQLTGTVIGDVPAPLDLHHLNTASSKEGFGNTQVFTAASPPEGEDCRVLGDQDRVVLPSRQPCRNQLQLQFAHGLVVGKSEMAEPQPHH